MATIRLAAKGMRSYVWYIGGTQEQADKHVESIAEKLESPSVEKHYPDLARRHLGKYGASKGWRRERLWTASGFTLDALGLDTGSRGSKVDDRRPDLMILDDVDSKHDGPRAVKKKIDTITTDILPAGSTDCAVMFIQNIIHPGSIAAMLANGTADFLLDRIISGPFPAIDNLTYRQQEDGQFIITGGTATWAGQPLPVCQYQINTWGLSAFLKEAQHRVEDVGGIWEHITFRQVEYHALPKFVNGCVWVDPAVTSTDDSDCQGIQAAGIDANGIIYMLYSWEGIESPESAMRRAILKALELGFDHVGVETDQGGDTWYSVYMRVISQLQSMSEYKNRLMPSFSSDKAGAGYGSKVERNAQMLVDYEHGMVIHVKGAVTMLETSLRRFPNKPLDLADAAFWAWNDLRGGGGWVMGMG